MKKTTIALLAISLAVLVMPYIAHGEVIIPDGPLTPGKMSEVTIIVREHGTKAPVEGAEVALVGCGINTRRNTNSKGEAIFAIMPLEIGKIKITATYKGMHPTDTEIPVVPDKSPPPLDLDPIPSPTNAKQIIVVGRTRPGCEVYVGRVKASVDEKGVFKATIQLVEGTNYIMVKSSTQYASTTKEFTVSVDTVKPGIILEELGKPRYVNVTSIKVVGRVEPGSKVTINGVQATVVNDYFVVEVPVVPGKNTLKVVAVDQVGNENSFEQIVEVWKRIVVQATIGRTIATVDGVETTLDSPPVIVSGRTMVPLRFIGEAFGAEFVYDATTKVITVKLGERTIQLTLNAKTATIDGKEVALDAPPVLIGGRTMVPVRFIAEAFGAEVAYDATTKTVTVTKEVLP